LTAAAPSLAILGGDEPLAEAILRLLEERDLEIGQVVPLAFEDTDACVSFKGEDIPVLSADGFDWRAVDAVIVASVAAAAQRFAAAAAQAGRLVLAAGDLPGGMAVAIGRVAGRVAAEAGVTSIHAGLNLPMSQFGQAGIEELSAQTRALFAMETPEPEVLPPRIAFNLVPHAAESRQAEASRLEVAVETSLRRLLGREGLPVIVFACWVPVFYGHSALLHVSTETGLESDRLRALLAATEGITVMDEPLPGGVPTPATDALDSDDVFVGRLRSDPRDTRQISVWMVFDGLRLEAEQIVEALENMIERNRKSVLT